MAAVQADLLVLPLTAGRIAARGDRPLGRLAKGCGLMCGPVMGVGRTVDAMRRSRSMMGREPMDRVRMAAPREERPRRVSRRAALRVRISSSGLNGYPYLRSASRATSRLVIPPTRPK